MSKVNKKIAGFCLTVFLGGTVMGCESETGEPSPYEEVNTLENVMIEFENDVYESAEDTFILNVINNSEEAVSYGVPYTLEERVDDDWYVVEPDEEPAFIQVLYSLEPGEEAQQEVNLEYYAPLESGNYRVVKEIEGEPLTAEFEIE